MELRRHEAAQLVRDRERDKHGEGGRGRTGRRRRGRRRWGRGGRGSRGRGRVGECGRVLGEREYIYFEGIFVNFYFPPAESAISQFQCPS